MRELRKSLIFLGIGTILAPCGLLLFSAQAENQSAGREWLQPANPTKLDWAILDLQANFRSEANAEKGLGTSFRTGPDSTEKGVIPAVRSIPKNFGNDNLPTPEGRSIVFGECISPSSQSSRSMGFHRTTWIPYWTVESETAFRWSPFLVRKMSTLLYSASLRVILSCPRQIEIEMALP